MSKLDSMAGKSKGTPKSDRVADHRRIITGNPFSQRDVDPKHLQPIPEPVDDRECPDAPAKGWEKRGVKGAGGWRFYWFHPDYWVRAAMWQFQIRGDGVDPVKQQFEERSRYERD